MKIAQKQPITPIKTILGLDISTMSVAYCLKDKDRIITFGEILFIGDNLFERLADAQDRIPRELKHLNLQYDMIVFESAVYIQNKRTVVLLAYAYGAVLSALMRKGVRVEDISPVVWQPKIGNPALTKAEKEAVIQEFPGRSKSWYTNKYREIRKQRTKDWVTKTFGLQVPTDNIGDAIGISKVAVDMYCE